MNPRSRGVTAESSELAWRLRSSKNTVVECRIRPTVSKLYTLNVVMGSETVLDEIYPDAASALRRAAQVRDRLMGSGEWAAIGCHSAPKTRAL
jgi:hypothetical protein